MIIFIYIYISSVLSTVGAGHTSDARTELRMKFSVNCERCGYAAARIIVGAIALGLQADTLLVEGISI